MTSVFRNLSINFETCFFAPFKSKLKDISIYSIYFELLDYLQWILALLCVQFPPFHPANNKYGTFYRCLTKNPAYAVTSNFTRSVIPRWAGYPSSRTYFMPTQNIDPIFTCTWLFFQLGAVHVYLGALRAWFSQRAIWTPGPLCESNMKHTFEHLQKMNE